MHEWICDYLWLNCKSKCWFAIWVY